MSGKTQSSNELMETMKNLGLIDELQARLFTGLTKAIHNSSLNTFKPYRHISEKPDNMIATKFVLDYLKQHQMTNTLETIKIETNGKIQEKNINIPEEIPKNISDLVSERTHQGKDINNAFSNHESSLFKSRIKKITALQQASSSKKSTMPETNIPSSNQTKVPESAQTLDPFSRTSPTKQQINQTLDPFSKSTTSAPEKTSPTLDPFSKNSTSKQQIKAPETSKQTSDSFAKNPTSKQQTKTPEAKKQTLDSFAKNPTSKQQTKGPEATKQEIIKLKDTTKAQETPNYQSKQYSQSLPIIHKDQTQEEEEWYEEEEGFGEEEWDEEEGWRNEEEEPQTLSRRH